MKRTTGDIWDAPPTDAWIVVPTNVGWKRDGTNVMGSGIAEQAKVKFDDLPHRYGRWCQENKDKLFEYNKGKLLCLPVKPLNKKKPWMSWMEDACPKTITFSYDQLKKWAEEHKEEAVKLVAFGTDDESLDSTQAMSLVKQAKLPKNVYLVKNEGV